MSTLSPPDDDALYITTRNCRARLAKVFNDPIHAHFTIQSPVLDAIDTPHVQRLRDLKQLGSTYFVFPGASHNRFEHSLGVAHLSENFISALYNNSRDTYAAAHYDNHRHFQQSARLVSLAGLCHDLGHGPMSHMFDYSFLPTVRRANIQNTGLLHHEERSVMLFQHMVDQHNIDIEPEHFNHIGQLIRGHSRQSEIQLNGESRLTPPFLFDVVSNTTTGIDTDKFDYLARDVYNIGLQGAYGFDYRRLIKFAKVIDDRICFHRKELFNVYHLFLTRYQLHRTVYNHRAGVSIDAMITDAFLHADKALKISDSINDPAQFLRMTDTLLPIIEFSSDKALETSRNIIRRIRTRKLYRFVDEVLLPVGVERKITAQQITTCQNTAATGVDLRPEDIHIAYVTLSFGMKDKNPIDNVMFFKDWDDLNPVHLSSEKASYVMPVQFQEKIIRIYVKPELGPDGDQIKQAAKLAFRNFMRTMNIGSPVHSPVMHKFPPDHEDVLAAELDEDAVVHRNYPSVTSSVEERVAKRRRPCVTSTP